MGKIIGFHIICCTYGFWLPNEERGSCSDFVRADHLSKFGPANPVSHSRSVARKSYDREIRQLARESLKYPPVRFNMQQIAAIGRGIAKELEEFNGSPMYAFASLQDHFHGLTGQCRYDIRRFAGRLNGAATRQLREEGIDPVHRFRCPNGSIPSPWSEKPWVVYEFTEEDMNRGIKYVNDNVKRAGLPPQKWDFVVPYVPQHRTHGAAHRR